MNLDKMAEVLKRLKQSPRPTYLSISEDVGVPIRTIASWVREMRNQGIDIPLVRGPRKRDLSSLK